MLYDVFIAHAAEDKDKLVRPLAKKLQQSYLEVWYDEFSLKPGDSLRKSIEKGLSQSRYGIVILSHAFFKKKWPNEELSALIERECINNESIIIPIWYKITAEDVKNNAILLLDRKALIYQNNIQKLCKELIKKIKPEDSPLIIARDILLNKGLKPPVVTDEWWLDVVEASNNIFNGGFIVPEETCWGRWTFPLPNYGARGKERGEWLAWTALQMQWETKAEDYKITQITHPKKVLKFIEEMPGLSEACHKNPLFLANYAPQLTIKGFSGKFEKDFDLLLEKSILKNKNSSTGSALTITKSPPACDEEIALRHPYFGYYESSSITCQYVNGELGGPYIRFYEIFDYLVWFLSEDSNWLPNNIHNFLLEGMKQWAAWIPDASITVNSSFSFKIIKARKENIKFTSKDLSNLLEIINNSLNNLEIEDNPIVIREKFLNGGFIEEYLNHFSKKSKKVK